MRVSACIVLPCCRWRESAEVRPKPANPTRQKGHLEEKVRKLELAKKAAEEDEEKEEGDDDDDMSDSRPL